MFMIGVAVALSLPFLLAETPTAHQALDQKQLPVQRSLPFHTLAQGREVLSLNGSWSLGLSDNLILPAPTSSLTVPGFVDTAQPPVRQDANYYWLVRDFTSPATAYPHARLKIGQAMYGKMVWLNGQRLPDHAGNFTPGEWDVTSIVARPGQTNRLVVCLGRQENLPSGSIKGGDYERTRYIPGIVDNVELTFTGNPSIVWTQMRPLVAEKKVGLLVLLRNSTAEKIYTPIEARIREAGTNAPVGLASVSTLVDPNSERAVYFEVPLPTFKKWSPESPNLYWADVQTSADRDSVRFGMRDFRFQTNPARSMLNGVPYPLRGSNITFGRFSEDLERGYLPWDRSWVQTLFRRFKDMGWNSLRFSIGIPPKLWYDIADEEGMIVQCEFPIWQIVDFPDDITVETLAQQYAEMMVEHWNHPSVCIWDGSNETPYVSTTGWAIWAVRGYDLSNRPWENGASEVPGDDSNPWECHPYVFLLDANYTLSMLNDLLGMNPPIMIGLPWDIEPYAQGHPKIVNEYDWLWLNRDGTPTPYTKGIYDRLLGVGQSETERRWLRALHTASLTEFWRHNPICGPVGVMQFCALTFSKNNGGGSTSDMWLPGLSQLQWDPFVYRMVRDSFCPVNVMVNQWWEGLPPVPAGSEARINLSVKNDNPSVWAGIVKLSFVPRVLTTNLGALAPVSSWSVPMKASANGGMGRASVRINYPSQPGKYLLLTQWRAVGRTLYSVREIEVR